MNKNENAIITWQVIQSVFKNNPFGQQCFKHMWT